MTFDPPLHLIDTGETRRRRPVYAVEHGYEYAWHFSQKADGALAALGISELCVRVPEGFKTDFATIPWFFWRVLPPDGPWRRAALVHDYLYSRAARCPRFLADAVFRHVMWQDNVSRFSRCAIYYAVRLFAGRGYHRR